MKPVPEELIEGHHHFAIIITWGYEADALALEKLNELWMMFEKKGENHDPLLDDIDRQTLHTYNLIGARTFLVIGQTKSNRALHSISARITFKTPISVEIYHAIEAHQVYKYFNP